MRWLKFFSRRSGKGVAHGDSPDEWQPGDMAECLYPGPWFKGGLVPAGPGFGPVQGEVRIVAEVSVMSPFPDIVPPATILGFSRYGPARFTATAFRKVTPRTEEALAADEAFIGQLRETTTPKPELVP